nr:thiamine pyrophosphate-dependent enzyme [Ensifer sp. ENS04]
MAIPEDILNEVVELSEVSLHPEPHHGIFPAYPSGPSDGDLLTLLELIGAAQRPLFVAGGGTNRSGAGAQLLQLAERMGMPIVNSITGQTAVPDSHPLAIGVIGDNGFHPHANRAMEEADLVIYWGCRVGSVVSIGWTFPTPSAERKIVQIDIDPTAIGNNTENTLSLCGDVGFVADRLSELLTEPMKVPSEWVERLNLWRAEFWSKATAEMSDASLPLRPQRVVKAFNQRLSGPFHIFSDPGTPTPHMTRLLRTDDAATKFIIPRAYGGLGYAIPATVGAWMANPHIRPVGLFGDGSFGMVCGELETLVRLNVPALLIHFNNGCYGWIKALQRLHGHNSTFSVDFLQLNAAAIAEAFGLRAWRVVDEESLERAFDEAFAFAGPSFIDIAVESIADVVPPVVSWLRRAGRDPFSLLPQSDIRLATLPQSHIG